MGYFIMKKNSTYHRRWKRYVTYAWVEGYRRFASVLRQNCPVGSICMRYGGDEFVCVVPDLDIRKLHQLEQNIQHALAELSSASHFSFPIEASIGSVIADDPVFSLNTISISPTRKCTRLKKPTKQHEEQHHDTLHPPEHSHSRS